MGTTRPSDGPIRTCVGCRERRPQSELLRCVLDAGGALRVDRRAPGRGAWLCGIECIESARRRRGFDRAFRTSVGAAAIDRLAAELNERPQRTTAERTGGERPRSCETEATTKG